MDQFYLSGMLHFVSNSRQWNLVVWGFISWIPSQVSTKKIGEGKAKEKYFCLSDHQKRKIEKKWRPPTLLATPTDLCKTYLFINIFQSVGLLGGGKRYEAALFFLNSKNIGQKIERVK